MPKKIQYTKITPLPSNVPRQLALDMLHSHGEIIELNPLVTGHKPITAPRDAARDEYFAQWYEIEEIITWGFGMKKKIAFKGCFHDMPWGLQTHMYAPMGVDLRNTYKIAGNQPGEPREVRELGIDAPAEGLYLKEDVEITCNIALASFVKKETKQTLETMIGRMTKKAELLDDGVLMAMFENGKLKTVNPNQIDRKARLSGTSMIDLSPADVSPDSATGSQQDYSPRHTFTKYSQLPGRMDTKRESKIHTYAAELDSTSTVQGSTQYVVPGKGGYLHPPSNSSRQFTAELEDTSSVAEPSLYSRRSYESEATDGQAAPGAYRSEDPARSRASGSTSSYAITNPDPATPSTKTPPYPTTHDAYAQAGLAQQINGLLIGGGQSTSQPPAPPQKIARCPMEKCHYEGSPEAISQHVNRHHFE